MSRPMPSTRVELARQFPGFHGFCANCHEEMWEGSRFRPRYGGICLQCAERRDYGERIGTTTGCAPKPTKACACCGVVKGRVLRGFCRACASVRENRVTVVRLYQLPTCSTCRDIRLAEMEGLRGSA